MATSFWQATFHYFPGSGATIHFHIEELAKKKKEKENMNKYQWRNKKKYLVGTYGMSILSKLFNAKVSFSFL